MLNVRIHMRFGRLIVVVFSGLLSGNMVLAQLSPGELSSPHSHLEGISNCTQCHVLGNKVSGDKCLACHTEIKERTDGQKGYHSSSDVRGKLCFSCHSEHNGKNFQLVRLDITKFDHSLTGFILSAPHAKKECKDCHIQKNITDQKLKSKKFTYLGVQTACLTCHADYHHQTLSTSCLNCHNPEAFKPASKFSHTTARFQLNGKHKTVDCLKCHKVETVNGIKFQEFKGVQFATCTNCHKDPHQNKFGQSCLKCHTEETFHSVKNTSGFDHNKTAFKLEDKHLQVDCNKCHKTKYTDPLKHDRCTDCHTDYHAGQFAKNGISPDCSQCHNVKGFTLFSYTVEQHNQAVFALKGSHGAVPCIDCHRKQEKWSFRKIGINCNDCHKDIHQRIIDSKYYPDANCKICHNESRWTDITFNHSATGFNLTGAHAKQSCRTCHFRPDAKGIVQQKFYELSSACTTCHTDNHFGQFAENGKTDCIRCHGTDDWKVSKFDHNKTAFKLDGKHVNVPCNKCHKPQQEGSFRYTKYKIKDFTCESCHY
jgi:hypothetical protein